MTVWRRVRGLVGITALWGLIGGFVGAAMYFVRYQPWPSREVHWDRVIEFLSRFVGAGALWGSICGLAFGIVIWSLGRRSSLQQISSRRFMAWGAMAGAAFPVLIYTPAVLRGAYAAIPFFSMITAVSTIAGALFAQTIFAMARRRTVSLRAATEHAASLSVGSSDSVVVTNERVRERV